MAELQNQKLTFNDVKDFINCSYSKSIASTYRSAINRFNIEGVEFEMVLIDPLQVANLLKNNGIQRQRLYNLFKTLKTVLHKMIDDVVFKEKLGVIDTTTIDSFNKSIIKVVYKDEQVVLSKDNDESSQECYSGGESESELIEGELIEGDSLLNNSNCTDAKKVDTTTKTNFKDEKIFELEKKIFELEKTLFELNNKYIQMENLNNKYLEFEKINIELNHKNDELEKNIDTIIAIFTKRINKC